MCPHLHAVDAAQAVLEVPAGLVGHLAVERTPQQARLAAGDDRFHHQARILPSAETGKRGRRRREGGRGARNGVKHLPDADRAGWEAGAQLMYTPRSAGHPPWLSRGGGAG